MVSVDQRAMKCVLRVRSRVRRTEQSLGVRLIVGEQEREPSVFALIDDESKLAERGVDRSEFMIGGA
jgi:hypothetical protein